jgi:hypothetical protein
MTIKALVLWIIFFFSLIFGSFVGCKENISKTSIMNSGSNSYGNLSKLEISNQ